MKQSCMNCPHVHTLSGYLPLMLAAKRHSKGQRYYPRPLNALAGSWDSGSKPVRPSCLVVCTTDSVPAV